MSLTVLALALASTIRPTSVAAIYALLCTHEPRRLLTAYIMAGFGVSVAFGIVVVAILHATITITTSPHAIIDLLLGVAALALAIRFARASPGPARPERTSRFEAGIARALRRPSLTVAATAGIMTHLPGLFYLAALTDILSQDPNIRRAVAQILLYNCIWFAAALAALALFILRPDDTRTRVAALNDSASRHQRSIIVILLALVGAYLTAKGLADLIG